jgi:hypothetical protein
MGMMAGMTMLQPVGAVSSAVLQEHQPSEGDQVRLLSRLRTNWKDLRDWVGLDFFFSQTGNPPPIEYTVEAIPEWCTSDKDGKLGSESDGNFRRISG